MAHYTEDAPQGESSGDSQESKYILDRPAFQSFSNGNRKNERTLTKAKLVQNMNGSFKATHRTTIPMNTRSKRVRMNALRHDGPKQQLLSTHEILDKTGLMVLMESESEIMKNKR